jgi:hypothetical protein
MCAVLSDDIAEWSEIAIEQRSAEESYDRGHVGRLGCTLDPYTSCTPHVS